MEKLFNDCSLCLGIIGGFLGWLLGGFDILLVTLIVLIILDYLSGVLTAISQKTLSSEVGLKGIIRKFVMLLVVAGMTAIQAALLPGLPLREMVIVFFISNEGISVLENAASLGIPFPEKLKSVLLQLRDSVGEKTKDYTTASSETTKEEDDGKKGN